MITRADDPSALWWRLRARYERVTGRSKVLLRVRARAEVASARYKAVLYAVGGLILAALGFAKLPWQAALALALVGFCLALSGLARTSSHVRRLRFSATNRPMPLVVGPKVVVRYKPDGRRSDQLVVADDAVLNRPVIVSGRYCLPAYLAEIRGAALAYHHGDRRRLTFNDLNLGIARIDDTTFLQLVAYFDHLCSASLGNDELTWNSSGAQTLLMSDLFISDGRLKDVNDNPFPNLIGVSTLGFTTDGQAVLVKQTSKNASSSGELAPTGSGSLAPLDAVGANTLGQAVTAGMRRELLEETGWPDDLIGSTTLVGWGQWAEKGGKPEFFGVTQLLGSSSELKAVRRVLTAAEKELSGELIFLSGAALDDLTLSFPILCCVTLATQGRAPGAFQRPLALLDEGFRRTCRLEVLRSPE